MDIRKARTEDIPAIIDLLKQSLGETSSPKSAKYWDWKHVHNPFGVSPVLLAVEEGQLVGVRAFMRWRWCYGAQTYSALRAVDTATHPDFQGRGIFKKLTLQLLADCQAAGDDFIFNTPNTQSLPGYLKMGWEEIGKLPVRLQIRRPLRMMAKKFLAAKTAPSALPDYGKDYPAASAFAQIKDRAWWRTPTEAKLYTPVDVSYLQWRYGDCPVQSYGAYAEADFLLVFYLREQSIGREMRLVQWAAAEDARKGALRRVIRQLTRQYQVDFVSVAPTSDAHLSSIATSAGFLPALPVGPVLTFRQLQSQEVLFREVRNWEYDLGTFELF